MKKKKWLKEEAKIAKDEAHLDGYASESRS
jgi:hypothetical protein